MPRKLDFLSPLGLRKPGYSLFVQDQGMSGRSLRRLPVLAHARYIGTIPMLAPRVVKPALTNGKVNGVHSGTGSGTDVSVWLGAMERVVESQREERGRLGS